MTMDYTNTRSIYLKKTHQAGEKFIKGTKQKIYKYKLLFMMKVELNRAR